MITGILIILGVIGWLLLMLGAGHYLIEYEYKKASIFAVVWILATGWVLGHAIKNEESRPCVEYGTTIQYNPATKMTMPVRYCKQYGEWIDEQR